MDNIYDNVQEAAAYLREHLSVHPSVAIICGSGLNGLASLVTNAQVFDYASIPHFPVSSVAGHMGKLVVGELAGKQVVCMQGRTHMYEGVPLWRITLPVRVFKCLGVETLIVTNAAGGLNASYKVGDIMIIRDHLNWPMFGGQNPLIGANDERLGTRFPAMSQAYCKDLRAVARRAAEELHMSDFVREGVYSMQAGPCYETIAECRVLSQLGADATGMSTVPEVCVAMQVGLRVLGFSLVTNMCVLDYDAVAVANHAEVMETGRMRANDMQRLVQLIVQRL